MGDTGSVFLGFLIGYVMIELSYYGYFLLILSAFAYPLLDISISLILRILKGRKPWERLGDFFFLLPKKKISYPKNFLSIDKKILLVGSLYLFFSFLTLQMSIYKQWHYIALLNFIFSFCLILLFKFRINR
jgi:UDP-N-acetylmuramyl pentapeptide phosphotransferase/UDP-N-acetylglucosamine-1-phosphate transferase